MYSSVYWYSGSLVLSKNHTVSRFVFERNLAILSLILMHLAYNMSIYIYVKCTHILYRLLHFFTLLCDYIRNLHVAPQIIMEFLMSCRMVFGRDDAILTKKSPFDEKL